MGSSCTFPALALEIAISQEALAPFTRKWCLEAKMVGERGARCERLLREGGWSPRALNGHLFLSLDLAQHTENQYVYVDVSNSDPTPESFFFYSYLYL